MPPGTITEPGIHRFGEVDPRLYDPAKGWFAPINPERGRREADAAAAAGDPLVEAVLGDVDPELDALMREPSPLL